MVCCCVYLCSLLVGNLVDRFAARRRRLAEEKRQMLDAISQRMNESLRARFAQLGAHAAPIPRQNY